ncbi:hypothetical protein Bca52824_001921 [Brassica carinata]|uniref:Uncharacterized protein n=1 Tax=Brassica carinata TaxID=52824 RepID=A0A8X7WJK5_BRACI|nr:hypothetical protein Bca52824_001921 [Brassica carinata]
MNLRMGELEKNQRLLKRRAKKIEDRLTSIESKGNEDVDRQWNDFDYGRDQGKDKEMGEEDEENSEKGEKKEEQELEKDKENSEKGEEEEEQEPEKDKENSESAEKYEEFVEESDEEDSLTNICEKARIQAEEFWRKLDDESDDEKEVEKEAEKREKTPTPPEKGAEKKPEETPTPLRGRTKAAAARRQSHTPPDNWIKPPAVEAPEKSKEIAVVENSSEDAEKMVEEQKKDEEAEKMVEEMEEPEEEAEKFTEEEKQGWYMVVYEDSTCKTKHDEEVEELEETAKPDKGAVRTGIRHRPKVMAVKGGSTRAERLAKKAQGTTKKRGRPKKIAATLKPCTPLPEKRKGEPSRWVQSPFTEGKTDEPEVPKKKPKTKA